MKLSLLAPGESGYYQRMVLDQLSRISLRLLGLLLSLVGLTIFTAGLGSALKFRALSAASDGFAVEMGLVFAACWIVGIVLFAVQAIRGNALDWFQIRKRGIALGPIAVYPPITPQMERESRLFVLGLTALVAVVFAAAILR
jgi:hypothetical protein